MSLSSVKISANERDEQSLFYIAEAALTYELEQIKDEIEAYYEETDTEESFFHKIFEEVVHHEPSLSVLEFEKLFGERPIAEISVQEINNENPRTYEVTAKAMITRGDRTKERSVHKQFDVEWQNKGNGGSYELPPLAVYTSGTMNLNSGTIYGNIGTQSTDQPAITFGNGMSMGTDGNIYVPVIDTSDDNRTCQRTPVEKYRSYSVSRPQWQDNAPCPIEIEDLWEIPELPGFTIPTFEMAQDFERENSLVRVKNGSLTVQEYGPTPKDRRTYPFTQSAYFEGITLTSNSDLYLDIGSNDRTMVVKNLDLSNGHIHLLGEGTLTIYVLEQITFGSGSTINQDGETKQVNLFYAGTERLQLSGAQKINGSIYAKYADLDFTAGSGFIGNIFSGGEEIRFSGGTEVISQLVLAPNAEVIAEGGSNFYGMIIAKMFKSEGGIKINYSEPFILDGPISPSALGNIPPFNQEGGHVKIDEKPIVQDP